MARVRGICLAESFGIALATRLLPRRLALDAAVPRASRSETDAERLAVMFPVIRCASAAFVLVVLNATLVVARLQEDADLAQSTALCVFEERVGEYAALHRRLEAPLPLKPSLSAYALNVRREYLARAMKSARPTARQGEFFTPDVAQLFRDLIDKALTGRDAEAMLIDLYDDHPEPLGFYPRVQSISGVGHPRDAHDRCTGSPLPAT